MLFHFITDQHKDISCNVSFHFAFSNSQMMILPTLQCGALSLSSSISIWLTTKYLNLGEKMENDLELNGTFPLEYSLIRLDKAIAVQQVFSLVWFLGFGFYTYTFFFFMISTVCFGVWQFDS